MSSAAGGSLLSVGTRLGLKDRRPPRKARTSLRMENMIPFPLNYLTLKLRDSQAKIWVKE